MYNLYADINSVNHSDQLWREGKETYFANKTSSARPAHGVVWAGEEGGPTAPRATGPCACSQSLAQPPAPGGGRGGKLMHEQLPGEKMGGKKLKKYTISIKVRNL